MSKKEAKKYLVAMQTYWVVFCPSKREGETGYMSEARRMMRLYAQIDSTPPFGNRQVQLH